MAEKGKPAEKPDPTPLDRQSDDIQSFLDMGPESAPGGEPEVRREEGPPLREEPPPRREPGRVPDEVIPPKDDRLEKALRSIETLQNEIATLKSTAAQPPRQPVTREPSVEMEEVLPGVRLAKDRSQWPIRLSPEALIKAGWNEDPAKAVETLANAFLVYIGEVLTPNVRDAVVTHFSSANSALVRERQFEDAYPDLKEHKDFMILCERRFRSEHPEVVRGPADEYFPKLAEYGRDRIAALRGMSREQYDATVDTRGKGAPAGPEPRRSRQSRMVTTGQGVRSSAGPKATGQQAEIDDTLR